MYKYIINIDAAKHDQFVKNHPLANLLQSSKWALIKDNWDHFLFSIIDKQDQIVASSLVLVKKVKGYSVFYIPRGPIMDYNNKALVKFYFQSLKTYAKTKNCVFIKFDPSIILKQYHAKEEVLNDPNSLAIINYLTTLGIKHHGFTKNIKDTFQPRVVMGVYQNEFNVHELPRRSLKSMRAASKKHVSVDIYNIDYLDQFEILMKLTEQRKNVNLRNKAYFKKLLTTYQDSGYLYLASVDLNKRYDELNTNINVLKTQLNDSNITNKQQKKLQQELNLLEKEYQEIKTLLVKYPTKTYIAGGLMVGFGTNMELLYAGMNEDFKHFYPQYLLYTKQFVDSFNNNYRFCSMGGVEGSLDDGLSTYKLAYNPMIIEYIGEFDLVIKKPLYLAYKMFMKLK